MARSRTVPGHFSGQTLAYRVTPRALYASDGLHRPVIGCVREPRLGAAGHVTTGQPSGHPTLHQSRPDRNPLSQWRTGALWDWDVWAGIDFFVKRVQ